MNIPLAASASTEGVHAAPVRAGGGNLTITCYENEVPSFVEAELERLYGSLFSSFAHYRVHGGIGNASTYAVHDGGELVSLLLYRRERNAVHVINEWIRVDDEEVARFARHVFARYPSVDIVTFHAVEADIRRLPFPLQRYNVTDDSVLTLPATADDYLAQLGKATRKNMRRYMNRLLESHPSFTYRVCEAGEIDEGDVRAIIALNRVRMADKGKISGIDAAEEERLVRLAKAVGFVGVARIDGRLCAGAIAFRIGNSYFSRVRAHDPAYDDYRLGLIGGFLLISECIARGGRKLHFMWGREEHKSILQGVLRDLDHLTLYRSRARMLACSGTVAKNAWTACAVRARLWLHEAKRENKPAWRLAMRLRRLAATLKGKAG